MTELAHRLELALTRLHQALVRASTAHAACWAITDEAIALLELEDCVVYLLQADRQTLSQQAAFGPKRGARGVLESQIRLQLGEGIVGACAQQHLTQWIDDVAGDSRYVADDAVRGSELAVPILYAGELIGVIDSEHSQPGFYTAELVRAFEQIAALSASHLQRLLAAADPD